MRYRSLLRKVVLAASALALAVPTGPVDAQTTESFAYDFFSATANATGLNAFFKIEKLLPINTLADTSTVFAESRLETTRSTALAALPSPGDALLNLPGTVAGFAQIPNLPEYPLAARADYPATPEQTVSPVPGNASGVGVVSLSAKAEESSATGVASATGLEGPAVFSIGSIRASTTSRQISPNELEAMATSELGDVRFAGGVVRIESITSLVDVSWFDGAPAVKERSVAVSGVTVAGQPAKLTEKGLEVTGQGVLPAVDLAALMPPGTTLRIARGSTDLDDDHVTASSGSVVLETLSTVQGAPSTFRLSFGSASATVQARGAQGEVVRPPSTGGEVSPPAAFPASGGLRSALPPRTSPAATSTSPSTSQRSVVVTTVLPVSKQLDFRSVYPGIALLGLAVAGLRAWVTAVARRRAALRSDLRPLWRW
jgi:hypothetical protein